MTTTVIILIVLLALNALLAVDAFLIYRKPAVAFDPETGTMYRFKLSQYSKEYYAVYLNATSDNHARVCSPYNWRNRTRNQDGTFDVKSPFTVPMNSLYK